MSALLFASARASVLSRRCAMPSSSIFRVTVASQPKSTFQYEYDKSFWQRFVEKRTKRVQELQAFWDADHSSSIWWKTTFDKTYTVSIGILISFVLLTTLGKYYLIATGKL